MSSKTQKTNSRRPLHIAVTGGGTSGHISPALSIIEAIKKLEVDCAPEFLYIGGVRGLERELVSAQGIDFVGIQTGKLRRYFSVENFIDQLRLPVGLAQSLATLKRFKPDVLLSTGGYVAVPPVIAASLLRVPSIIHEQTVQIGLANRITSRFATRIALSFESARSELSASAQQKAFVAGNPIRGQIFNGDAKHAGELFGFRQEDNGLPIIYITGGSLGARVINRAVEEVLPQLLDEFAVIHQCGKQSASEETDFQRLQRAATALPGQLRSRYFVTEFVGLEINHVFAVANLVVGRAGAGTVAELCALGKPALYIPLVPTGGDEQSRNAQMCVDAGAAQILKQADCTGTNLLVTVRDLLAKRSTLRAMGEAAKTLARPKAAITIAQAVITLARGENNMPRI